MSDLPSDAPPSPLASSARRRLTLAGVSLLAAPLWPGGACAAIEKPDLTLAVGGKPTLYYLPLTLAERLGCFRDEGLSVEIVDFPGGAKALQALVGGSADVVSGAYEHTIAMQTLAQKVQAFVLQGTNPGLELGIVKAKWSAYSWPKDLKGMRVGVSAPGSSTARTVPRRIARSRRNPQLCT